MSGSRTPEEWAQTVRLESPVRWGEVEDEILRREPEFEFSAADVALRAVGLTFLAVVGVLVMVSPVVGLLLERADAELALVRFCFVIAAGVPVAIVVPWWADRDRGLLRIAASGFIGVVSLIAYLQFRTAEEPDGLAGLLMLLAAVLGIGVAVLMLVASRPAPDAPRRRRWSLHPAKDIAYGEARGRVLDILVERGVVTLSTDERTRMNFMPLGTWHSLDTKSTST